MAERLAESLQAALADLAKWLEQASIPATIIGGIAASILGRPRLTRDIDALAILPEAAWAKAVQTAEQHGILPRIDDAVGFARRSRVLLLRHTASGIDLDVVIGALPFEKAAVEKSTTHNVGGVLINLPRVEDLLIMKAVAGRPKDLEDIRGLLDAHSEADVDEVRRWIREFASATGMGQMLEEFDKLLEQRKTRR